MFTTIVFNHRTETDELEDMLNSAMNGVFLIKDDMGSEELMTVLMILWRAGDTLIEENDYASALPWYRCTWSICSTSFKNHHNTMTLARKLAICYMQNNEADNAYKYLHEAMNDADEVSANDYLLLIYYDIKRSRFYSDQDILIAKLMETADFDMDIITDLIGLCYTEAMDCRMLEYIMKHLMNIINKNGITTNTLHQLILIIRCLIHKKINAHTNNEDSYLM
ncbi:hypothetical protein BDB01DRAFT_133742 [Pilobolus umbonatus]|nr:hypothetical protein BDB01DRAFT_133742 [Pilobolus umbonatus]